METTARFASLRRESFGGTLLLTHSGKRLYVTPEEFGALSAGTSLPLDLMREVGADSNHVLVRNPAFLPEYNFSSPDGLYLELTRACNLTCSHCLNDSGRKGSGELDQEAWARVVDDAAASGVQDVRFTGGEPLVFPGLADLINQAVSSGLRTGLGTNGVLVTDKVATGLAQAGLHSAIVSIDGLQGTHDAVRGAGSYSKALAGLRRLQTQGIDVRVNVTVMKRNVSEMPELVDLLGREQIRVNLRRFIPSGRGQITPGESLSEADYGDLRAALRTQLDDPRKWLDGHYLTFDEFRSRIPLPFARKSCRAGHRGLAVMPDGSVYTCGFLAQLGETAVGRVPNERFSDIWRRLIESSHIQEMETVLATYNLQPQGPSTRCLAIGRAFDPNTLIQLRRKQ